MAAWNGSDVDGVAVVIVEQEYVIVSSAGWHWESARVFLVSVSQRSAQTAWVTSPDGSAVGKVSVSGSSSGAALIWRKGEGLLVLVPCLFFLV